MEVLHRGLFEVEPDLEGVAFSLRGGGAGELDGVGKIPVGRSGVQAEVIAIERELPFAGEAQGLAG